jgi:uncharacterized protein (DUF1778 family)
VSATRQSAGFARLEARVSPEQKELIQRAADLEGRSLTDYLVGSATAAAQQTIQRHQVLQLTARATEAFIAAIENPPAPGKRLRAAAQRYRDFVGR